MRKITIIGILFAFISSFAFSAEVNVFSARHYDSDFQLYEKFTSKTGIKVNVVSGKDKALQKRIMEEGADCVGDLYITADAGRLGAFQAKGMLQKAGWSKAIKNVVPSQFRSAQWTGIAKRARIIYYSPERVSANELNGMTYEGLADPKWKGRLVIRKSNNIYNQSLVASLVKNKGNDRAQIMAVAAGEADIAVANTYYHALMLSGKKGAEQQEAAKKVMPFFPNQQDRGTHMNISGAGMLKYAPNKSNAVKLVEFLLTTEAQNHIVNNTFEYPMISGVSANDLVPGKDMSFKQDNKTSVKTYGAKQAEALEVMLAAGWK